MRTNILDRDEIVRAVGEWLKDAGVSVGREGDLCRDATPEHPFELLVLSLTGPICDYPRIYTVRYKPSLSASFSGIILYGNIGDARQCYVSGVERTVEDRAGRWLSSTVVMGTPL